MADNAELRVVEVIEREPRTYGRENKVLASSGATYYHFNSGTSVKHTTSDTWVCLKSTCGAYYDGENPTKGKGCEHTRCAMKWKELRDNLQQL